MSQEKLFDVNMLGDLFNKIGSVNKSKFLFTDLYSVDINQFGNLYHLFEHLKLILKKEFIIRSIASADKSDVFCYETHFQNKSSMEDVLALMTLANEFGMEADNKDYYLNIYVDDLDKDNFYLLQYIAKSDGDGRMVIFMISTNKQLFNKIKSLAFSK